MAQRIAFGKLPSTPAHRPVTVQGFTMQTTRSARTDYGRFSMMSASDYLNAATSEVETVAESYEKPGEGSAGARFAVFRDLTACSLCSAHKFGRFNIANGLARVYGRGHRYARHQTDRSALFPGRLHARMLVCTHTCARACIPTPDAAGAPYYYNEESGVTQWDRPADASTQAPVPKEGEAAITAVAASASGSGTAAISERMSVTDDYMDIEVCSKFFVESFWEKSTTTMSRPVEMTNSQRKAVEQEQLRDLQDRYGKLLGERKLKSALVVLRDQEGRIEACCGVELAVADTEAFELLARAEGEQMLKGGLAALGGRSRNELRGQPVQMVAARVLPQGYALIPVLSNLAVRESSRGQGLAKQVCQQCEVIAAGWGFSEMMLLVEEANAPARKLYESLGYQRVWTRNLNAARVAADGQGALTTEKVPTNAMAKAL